MLRYLNPLTYLKWIGQFIYAWGMSLPWSSAPMTIPALALVLLLSIASVVAFSSSSNNWRSNLLKRQLMTALDTDDFDTAELLLQRQVLERPDDGDLRFRLAMIQSEKGKEDEAVAQMQRLVSQKRHKEAARWIVREKFDKRKWSDLNEADRQEFGDLTKLMFDEYPKDAAVKNLYADYLIASGSLVKALPILRDLARANPLRGLQAAAVARRLKLFEEADAIAERSLNAMSTMSEEDPTNLSVSLAVAQNQLFLERFSESIQTLDRAIKLAKTPQEQQLARQAFGDAIVAFVKHIEENSQGTVAERVKILEWLRIALDHAPKNPRVLTVVSNQVLATLNDDNDQINAVREALVKGVSPGVAHFIRGTAALMENDSELATRELKLASEHMPLSSAVMNNLAVVLLHNENVDLEQPLKIIQEAINLSKSSPPHYYETRGQILMRMERYEDAISDLERALTVLNLEKKAHQDLAICYEKIGDVEMSKLHEQAAVDFEKNQAIAQEEAKKKAEEKKVEVKPDEANPAADGESDTIDTDAIDVDPEADSSET